MLAQNEFHTLDDIIKLCNKKLDSIIMENKFDKPIVSMHEVYMHEEVVSMTSTSKPVKTTPTTTTSKPVVEAR